MTVGYGSSRQIPRSIPLLVGLAVAILLCVQVARAQTSSSTYDFCTPNPVDLGASTTCYAVVIAPNGGTPTGNVTFSVTCGTSGCGTFSPSDICILSGTLSYCSVTYTPSIAGTHVINASYGGDSNYLPSVGTFSLTVVNPSVPEFPSLLAVPVVFVAGAFIYLALRRRTTLSPLGGQPS